MHSLFKYAFAVAVFVFALLTPRMVWAQTALVIHDGSAGVQADVVANVSNKLADAGYTVTTSVGAPGGGLAGYEQVWDVRVDWTLLLTGAEMTACLSYLNGGGSLFLASGDSSEVRQLLFPYRDDSIADLVWNAGGDHIQAHGPTSNPEIVQSPFTGPHSVAAMIFSSHSAAPSPGTGANGYGSAAVWDPGTLSAAPAPPTLILALLGASAAALYTLRRRRKAAALLTLAVLIPGAAWAQSALIIDDADPAPFARPQLTNNLAAGYTVTASVGVPPGGLSGYEQVWDIRDYATIPLSSSEIAAYATYLGGGGSLFLLGSGTWISSPESPTPDFDARNNSIASLVATVGGGAIVVSYVSEFETVQWPFNGPYPITGMLTFAGGKAPATPGTGAFATLDSNNRGAAVAWGQGSLSAAPTGKLIAVFHEGFLQQAYTNTQNFVRNMISYLKPPAAPVVPAPPTLVLALLGGGAAALYRFRRRRRS